MSEREREDAVIRVALADDQILVRAGFRALLAAQPDIEVVGEAADGEQALALVREQHPDVVLMDIRMPVLDGLAATRRITEDPALGEVKVVMLTTFELDEYGSPGDPLRRLRLSGRWTPTCRSCCGRCARSSAATRCCRPG
ncbi:Protein-glutamate methylesterase/protein-glutamine glutaminase [Streptomyces antimycoticus]